MELEHFYHARLERECQIGHRQGYDEAWGASGSSWGYAPIWSQVTGCMYPPGVFVFAFLLLIITVLWLLLVV